MSPTCPTSRDEFFWLNQISIATLLVGLERGQFSVELALLAARGIAKLESDAKEDASLRVKRYIDWEPKLLAITGPAVSVIHAGRSSQDILSTVRCALFRDGALETAKVLHELIAELLKLAQTHRDTIVQSYTNGVAAQPTSLGHTFLAYAASLLRSAQDFSQTITNFDACAMGAMVLNGTGWALDREAMAKALGFPRPVANAFDATCFSPVDFPLTASGHLAHVAVRLSSFINDVMTQYATPRPWILLQEGQGKTYISSAMPQKRNPGLLNSTREEAADLLSDMMGTFARAHNVSAGMPDGKSTSRNLALLSDAHTLFTHMKQILSALVVNEERALEELNSDWTASQEVADRLMRLHNLPFRIGHHLASRMVSVAKKEGFAPLTFPYARLTELYREVVEAEFPEAPHELPMSEAEFRSALDPKSIVAHRATLGSAAPAEVDRLLEDARQTLEALEAKRAARVREIAEALCTLQERFKALQG